MAAHDRPTMSSNELDQVNGGISASGDRPADEKLHADP